MHNSDASLAARLSESRSSRIASLAVVDNTAKIKDIVEGRGQTGPKRSSGPLLLYRLCVCKPHCLYNGEGRR